MVVDYQSGKIYKLWSPSNDLVYIGSTIQPLSMRKGGHVVSFKQWQNGKYGFTTSFTILECEDNRIDLLEAYPCNNKTELLAREGYWIKKLNCVNKFIPNRKHQEYYDDNKEKIKEQSKQYYVDNKEKLKENAKVKCSCSCGSNFRQGDLARHIKTEKHQTFLNSSKEAVLILVG
jgi:hypothetical protein